LEGHFGNGTRWKGTAKHGRLPDLPISFDLPEKERGEEWQGCFTWHNDEEFG
jgi:hypothetical protein